MTYLIGQIIFCLVIAFLLGFFLAWLIFKRQKSQEAEVSLKDLSTDHAICKQKLATLQNELDEMTHTKEDLEGQLALISQEAASSSERDAAPPEEPETSAPAQETSMDWKVAYDVAIQRAALLQRDVQKEDSPPTLEDANKKEDPEETEDTDNPPLNLFRAAPDHRDNLERIKGIGPTLHRMLNQLGIYQFQQIANFSERDIHWVASNLKAFKSRVTQDNWVAQAAEFLKKSDDT